MLSDLQAQGAWHLDQEAAWNAQAYLQARRIPLDVAHCARIGYVAPGAASWYGQWIRRWEDRLLFPLRSPDGTVTGFTGRLIAGWQSCHDAAAHHARLRAIRHDPWIMTDGTGWFWSPEQLPASDPVIIVEGPFDRLSLLAPGHFESGEVIALVGMRFQPAWLSTVRSALFALNTVRSSREAGDRLTQYLAWKGARVEICHQTTRNGQWSERWRREGMDALEALYAHHALLAHDL